MTSSLDSTIEKHLEKVGTDSESQDYAFRLVIESYVLYYSRQYKKNDDSARKALSEILFSLRTVKDKIPKFSNLSIGQFLKEVNKRLEKLKSEYQSEEELESATIAIKNFLSE